MSKWSSAYRDTRWYKLRNAVMERDNYTCQSCGASGEGVVLNVHHAYYEAGKAPWEYDQDTLVLLCDKCHESYHNAQNYIAKMICNAVRSNYNHLDLFLELTGYIDGVFGGNIKSKEENYITGYTKALITDVSSVKQIMKSALERMETNG